MNKKISLSTTHIILISFIIVIFIGSVLLALPISSKNRISVDYIDALFTATTSTCVTGLVTVPTYSTWSMFGQIVILILIQIGGLGVVAFMSAFMIIINKKLKFKDYQLIQDAFNLNTMSGLKQFIKHVFLCTLLIEVIGAILYMFVFIPDYGAKGIWISIFNSVSAFCNAGMDVIGEVSLFEYATNPLVNVTTSLLIVLGGLGFIVWWDILRVMKQFKNKKFNCFKSLTLHSKIVISSTLVRGTSVDDEIKIIASHSLLRQTAVKMQLNRTRINREKFFNRLPEYSGYAVDVIDINNVCDTLKTSLKFKIKICVNVLPNWWAFIPRITLGKRFKRME